MKENVQWKSLGFFSFIWLLYCIVGIKVKDVNMRLYGWLLWMEKLVKKISIFTSSKIHFTMAKQNHLLNEIIMEVLCYSVVGLYLWRNVSPLNNHKICINRQCLSFIFFCFFSIDNYSQRIIY